jgi:hypothetical protein
MNWKDWGTALGLLSAVTGTLLPFSATPLQPVSAAPLHGSTDPDRDDWQPNARVDPTKPVQVVFVNNFGEMFRYTLMGHTNAREIPKGQTAKLGKVPIPAYIAINPARDHLNIRYKVSVSNNIVFLEVKPAKGYGQRALEINNKGEIYAY